MDNKQIMPEVVILGLINAYLAYGAFHGYVCDQSYNKFPKLCFIKPIWKSQIWANEHKTFNPILNLHKYASI